MVLLEGPGLREISVMSGAKREMSARLSNYSPPTRHSPPLARFLHVPSSCGAQTSVLALLWVFLRAWWGHAAEVLGLVIFSSRNSAHALGKCFVDVGKV